jgi:hypothetical protein
LRTGGADQALFRLSAEVVLRLGSRIGKMIADKKVPADAEILA